MNLTSMVNKKLNLIKILVILSIYSTSFDIFLVVNILGFNFRFTQMIFIPVILNFTIQTFYKKKLSEPYAINYLLVWFVIQAIFSLRSPSRENAIGYNLWLLFDILVVFAIHFHLNVSYTTKSLLKIYINSFEFMAIIGLIQFFLYPLGINFYLMQFWGAKLARINGFSYEPSYYSTYLIIGYIICSYLLYCKNEEIFNYKKLKRKHFIITMALILSTSRMGWIMVALWNIIKFFIELKKIIHRCTIKKKHLTFLCMLILIVYLFFIAYKKLISNFSFLLGGLGLLGASDHSSSARLGGLSLSFRILKDSPFIGYGLGGVDPITAQYLNINYSTLINGLSTSIVGDLLVASGSIAVILIIIYFFKLINVNKNETDIKKALATALFFELIILVFNQNILRPYLWMHIAIMSAVYRDKITFGNNQRFNISKTIKHLERNKQ